jgi:ubiquinone biosynthesis protein
MGSQIHPKIFKFPMKLSANHLNRYRQIATILWKYGRADLVQHMDVEEGFDLREPKPPADKITPEQLADDLEAMGPTYVKLGQVLAGRPDLLPDAYLKALARLQDRVKPFSYAEVEETVQTELGIRISKAFSRFDPVPLAAASLGQVHLAALRDGRPVVVKVQRPHIRKQIAQDFEVLAEIAEFLDEHTDLGRRSRFARVLEEFRVTIQQELNYEQEAQNLVMVGNNLKEFELLQVPQPVHDYCSRCVLTMDYVHGRKITSLHPLDRLDMVEGGPLAEELFKAYLKQVLVDGIFHADPHPGNVFITDGGHVALLDLGMVGRTGPVMQEKLLKLIMAISSGNGDDAADVIIDMSEKMEVFEAAEFRRKVTQQVAKHQDQGLQQINLGRTLLEVSADARNNGLFVPSELTLLGKTLLQLDEVGRVLDPTFDPNAAVRRNLDKLISQRLFKDATKGNIFTSLLEMKDFLSHLPVRLNRVMDVFTNAEFEVKVKAVDAEVVINGMQKIANRIATSIVLAALIMGAALLMRIETSFHLFGYPGLAILCFLSAVAGALWLIVSILIQDRRKNKKHHHR